jgi:hypothetical protein
VASKKMSRDIDPMLVQDVFMDAIEKISNWDLLFLFDYNSCTTSSNH